MRSEWIVMPAILIDGISDDTHEALHRQASEHGRSIQAKIRAILDEALRPEGPLKIGSALAALGEQFGGVDLRFGRDQRALNPAVFD